jgi:hypothetical protein
VSENDGDASSETTASDTSPRDTDCPLGSGWPCTCSLGAGNYCDDDSPCVPLPGGAPGLGVCLASCDPSLDLPPLQLCPATDYPAPGWCRMRQNPTGDATHCLLTCAGSFARTCPPDQQCHVETEGQMGFCVPKP